MNYLINEKLYENLPKYLNTSKGIVFSPEHLSEDKLNYFGVYLTNVEVSGSASLYKDKKISGILKNGNRFDIYVVYEYKDIEEIKKIKIDSLKLEFENYKEIVLGSLDENEFKNIILQAIAKLAQGKNSTTDNFLNSLVKKYQNYTNKLQEIKDKIQEINNSSDADFIVNL